MRTMRLLSLTMQTTVAHLRYLPPRLGPTPAARGYALPPPHLTKEEWQAIGPKRRKELIDDHDAELAKAEELFAAPDDEGEASHEGGEAMSSAPAVVDPSPVSCSIADSAAPYGPVASVLDGQGRGETPQAADNSDSPVGGTQHDQSGEEFDDTAAAAAADAQRTLFEFLHVSR